MIQINLALRKQSVGAAPEGGTRSIGTQFTLSRFTGQLADFKDFPVGKVAVPVVLAIVATLGLDFYKDRRTAVLDQQLKGVQDRKTEITAKLNTYKSLEEVKKSIEKDLLAIRTKKNAIDSLIAGRTIPPRMLLTLASSTPKDVWLTEFKVENAGVDIKGYALGFNRISELMRSLGETVYFGEVNVKSTQQAKDESGVDVAAFELMAKRRREKEEAAR